MGKKEIRLARCQGLGRVEAMSEDPRYPIKSAFEEDGHGWRAVEIGEQTIQLVFDERDGSNGSGSVSVSFG